MQHWYTEMSDHYRKILDTTCDHRLEHGLTGACGGCYEQRGTHIKQQAKRTAKMEAAIALLIGAIADSEADCKVDEDGEVEFLERIAKLEERNSYLKSWGDNQYGNLKEHIAKLEAETQELSKGNIKRWEDMCAMANRIANLEAELKGTVTTKYHDDLMQEWKNLEVVHLKRIANLKTAIRRALKRRGSKHPNAVAAVNILEKALAEVEDEECTHPAHMVTFTTDGDYCECGETLSDFTGSNEMGG
ncbi:MAG: hypothetical protein IH631_08465 [Candidatus Thorarchaeota archaeon]|nr:hypothetical protein [Candidatus Thorarchaeota archaeon]